MLETIKKLRKGEEVFIVCTGDSITEQNYHTHGKLNYVGQLGVRLSEQFGRKSFVMNTGVSGDSVLGLTQRMERDVLRYKPNLVTLMFGVNDSVGGVEKLEVFSDTLKNIIKQIQNNHLELLLFTQQPLNFNLVESHTVKRKDYPEYVKAVRAIACLEGIPLCDLYMEWEKSVENNTIEYWPLMNDALHPNEYGHDFFSELLFKYLEL